MNQKGSTIIILVIIIAVLASALGYTLLNKKKDLRTIPPTQSGPTLTNEIAHSLAIAAWGSCADNDCATISVVTRRIGAEPFTLLQIVATYEGLRDDSIQALRYTAPVQYENEAWIIGEVTRTHTCWKGRGHQDFSTELCT